LGTHAGLCCETAVFINHANKYCGLCQYTFNTTKHCSSDKHLDNVKRARRYRDELANLYIYPHAKITELSESVPLLGLPRWRMEIEAILFQYCHYGHLYESKANTTLKAATKLHKKYMILERLSCLELAVWKAFCLLKLTRPLNTYDDCLWWLSKGWKDNKPCMRHNPGIYIIMTHVTPFVKKHA
jgi:hypothetical protein